MIHWKLGKKFKFDHTNKLYLHKPASVLVNETHKLLWDFDIQTDHLISARRPDFIIINNNNNNKRTCKIVDFAVLADHRVKLKECEKRDKYLDLVRELKKTVEHASDDYTNCNWCSRYTYQRIIKGTGGLRNKRSGDHPNYVIEIGQNTEKSPGDLRRLVVTQNSMKDHQLTLM